MCSKPIEEMVNFTAVCFTSYKHGKMSFALNNLMVTATRNYSVILRVEFNKASKEFFFPQDDIELDLFKKNLSPLIINAKTFPFIHAFLFYDTSLFKNRMCFNPGCFFFAQPKIAMQTIASALYTLLRLSNYVNLQFHTHTKGFLWDSIYAGRKIPLTRALTLTFPSAVIHM